MKVLYITVIRPQAELQLGCFLLVSCFFHFFLLCSPLLLPLLPLSCVSFLPPFSLPLLFLSFFVITIVTYVLNWPMNINLIFATLRQQSHGKLC